MDLSKSLNCSLLLTLIKKGNKMKGIDVRLLKPKDKRRYCNECKRKTVACWRVGLCIPSL